MRDGDLLLLVSRARDRDAFSELYSRKARPVYSLIQRQLGDRVASDDAVQEASSPSGATRPATAVSAAMSTPGSSRSRAMPPEGPRAGGSS
jgi:hypothetical protein